MRERKRERERERACDRHDETMVSRLLLVPLAITYLIDRETTRERERERERERAQVRRLSSSIDKFSKKSLLSLIFIHF